MKYKILQSQVVFNGYIIQLFMFEYKYKKTIKRREHELT
jgi:hypothetical protein